MDQTTVQYITYCITLLIVLVMQMRSGVIVRPPVVYLALRFP